MIDGIIFAVKVVVFGGVTMITQKVVVTEPLGLHLRPAGVFCEESLKFESKIQIRKGTSLLNAKSVLGVLAAGVKCGDEIELVCDGSDEQEAIERLTEILRGGKIERRDDDYDK